MADISTEHLILWGVILLQLAVGYLTIVKCRKIQSLFAADEGAYSVKLYVPGADVYGDPARGKPILATSKESPALQTIIKNVNAYLVSHYKKSKVPDVATIESMIKMQSRQNDSLATLLASFPILLGLAGTITGLIYAFSHMQATHTPSQPNTANMDPKDFLSLIAGSASIVFYGSLFGILLSMALNYFVSYSRLKRDNLGNHLNAFIHTHLSPSLPTIREETLHLVSTQMNVLNDEFLSRFQAYTQEFTLLTDKIKYIYETGLKDVLEKNSAVMTKLTDNLLSLEALNATAKNVSYQPQMITEFVSYSQQLLASHSGLMEKTAGYEKTFIELNQSFVNLQNRIDSGVTALQMDRNLIADFHTAMKTFATNTTVRAAHMNTFAEQFDKNIEDDQTKYQHALNELRDKLMANIKDNLNPSDYIGMLEKLQAIAASLASESDNIKLLATSLNGLSDKVGNDLTPKLARLSDLLENELLRSFEDTMETNKAMVLDTSRELLKEPRSWGQWSYLKFTKMISGKKPKRHERK